MSVPELSPDDLLAAEYALGLLEGERLLQARARLASDRDFSCAVEWWEVRLGPLLDEIGSADPGPGLWERIERHLAADTSPASDFGSGEVIALRRRVRAWRMTAAMALAASVAALVFALLPLLRGPTAPPTTPAVVSVEPPLLTAIPAADMPLRLAVTYIPERRELLISADGITADGVHDHELWLVLPESAPQSLGVIEPGATRRVEIDPALARHVRQGAQLALSREPLGGKPADREVGPIVGLGTLAEI